MMMRTVDAALPPTAPIPPEIEGYLKKLKRKTRSLAGNWNKRWFFVDPRRREFGYSDNRTSAPRSSIYLDDITAVVQFDDTHFQVESRTRNFFLCGESKASTACWVTSLEGYRKKLIEHEKDKIAYVAATASVKATASALCVKAPQQSQSPASAGETQASNKKKKHRDNSEITSPDERQPTHDSFGSSSSSSMSSTASSSSKSKRASGKTEYSPSDRLPPKSEQRSASPLTKDNSRRPSSRSKNRSPPASPSDDKRTRNRDRPRDRERGRDRDRERKFERESTRESSNDDRSDRERSGNSDRDRSRDKTVRAPTGRGSVMQAWVDDF